MAADVLFTPTAAVLDAWGDFDDKAFDVHLTDMAPDQAHEAAGGAEMADGDERRHVAPSLVVDSESGSFGPQGRKHPDVQPVELYGAIEAIRQRGDDGLARSARRNGHERRQPERQRDDGTGSDEKDTDKAPPHQVRAQGCGTAGSVAVVRSHPST
jgi:hypothetical protein